MGYKLRYSVTDIYRLDHIRLLRSDQITNEGTRSGCKYTS